MKNRLIALLIMIVLALAACANDNQEGQPAAASHQTAAQENPDEPQMDFAGQTLSIAVTWSNSIDQFAELYMEANPGVTILINNFDGDFERYMEQIPIQLMAGTADDLIDTMGIDEADPSTTALLADWFPVIQAAPNFNEADYFMNVFEAASINGQLFVFPMVFSFDMISANNSVPGLADAFRGRSGISAVGLQELLRAFPSESPLSLHENHDILNATFWGIENFLDFENRTSHFNTPEFIDFLTEAREMTSPEREHIGWMMSQTYHSPEALAEQSQLYYFRQSIPQSYQFMLPFQEELLFSGHIPFTNDRGQLMVSPFFSYALNGRSTPEVQALAFDFLRFMQDPSHFEGDIWMYTMVPVYRPLLRSLLEWELPGRIAHFEEEYGWRLTGSTDQAVAGVIAEFESILQMPMTRTFVANEAVMNIIFEVIGQFDDGLLTAEQAAADLQNRVSLALMELG